MKKTKVQKEIDVLSEKRVLSMIAGLEDNIRFIRHHADIWGSREETVGKINNLRTEIHRLNRMLPSRSCVGQ